MTDVPAADRAPLCATPPLVPLEAASSAPPTLLFAIAAGLLISDITATQPLVGAMRDSLAISEGLASLVATLALLGYAAGLLFIVPLADRMEARKLALLMLALGIAARLALAGAPSSIAAFGAAFAVGIGSSAVQVLVPLAASMAPEHERGKVVGNIMAGVMAGILLSRPLAGLIADFAGWRAFFLMTAGATTLLSVVLALRLPDHPPRSQESYRALLASLATLVREEPVLRRRSLTAALGMAAFSSFWTMIALRLAEAPFSLSASQIAVFALAGCGTILIAPLAGRAGDRGWTKGGTHVAHIAMLAGVGIAALAGWLAQDGAFGVPLALLVVAGLVLDMGCVGDQTLGRRAINMIRPAARGRMNGLFSGIFFIGGAIGASLSGVAYASGGWLGVCALIAGFSVIAGLIGLSEPR
ncbi:MFS transporter [Roseixanthobacter glucoisosaccharinicivorans]|uniref:MFS transporter n=1 Tax=Roseixanthobacter glucoisosaccharinicivorans TaxID=3119923 RepID=UPI00372BE95D